MLKPRNSQKQEKLTQEARHDGVESSASVSKSTPMAEILLLPDGKDAVPGVNESQVDLQAKARWLQLADETLGGATRARRHK